MKILPQAELLILFLVCRCTYSNDDSLSTQSMIIIFFPRILMMLFSRTKFQQGRGQTRHGTQRSLVLQPSKARITSTSPATALRSIQSRRNHQSKSRKHSIEATQAAETTFRGSPRKKMKEKHDFRQNHWYIFTSLVSAKN